MNIYQADGDTGLHKKGAAISFRCPHCMTIGAFQNVHDQDVSYVKVKTYPDGSKETHLFLAAIRKCPNTDCRGLAFVVQEKTGSGDFYVLPPERIDFDPSEIPDKLLATLEEAIACHAVGAFRASAMMVRRLLEEICDDANASGKNLHERLQSLKGNVVLPVELFDAMQELKALGNDAAHIEAKSYDNIGPGEAADSLELAKEILKARYQLQGLVKRLQARRKTPAA